MVAINFKKEFAEKVVSGSKKQTVRKERKYQIHVGMKLQLYTGMRTKSCRLLKEVVCTQVDSITISEQNGIEVNDKRLNYIEAIELAEKDGFTGHFSGQKFIEFFMDNYGLPFHGVIIKW